MRQNEVGKIEEIAQRLASAHGLEVVEVELKGSGRNQLLRIYVDKPEGVSHEDCQLVSQKVGEAVDAENLFPGNYTLEVSSPGVERKLKRWKDFERFQGKRIKIVLREPLDEHTHFEGILQSAQDGELKLELKGGKLIQFPFERIDRANLKFEW